MKTAIAITLIVMGAYLIATPVVMAYLSATQGVSNAMGDASSGCKFAGGAMVLAGVVFASISLRSGGDGTKRN